MISLTTHSQRHPHANLGHIVLAVLFVIHQIYLLEMHSRATRYGDETNMLFFSRHVAATGQWFLQAADVNRQYIPPTFVSCDGIHYVSRYAPGKIMLFVLADRFASIEGIFWLNRLEGLVGAIAFYLLLIRLFQPSLAVLGAVFLLLIPPYTFFMITYMTHPVSLAFILVSLAFLRSGLSGSHLEFNALMSGLTLGMTTAIRYNNIVIMFLWLYLICFPHIFTNSAKRSFRSRLKELKTGTIWMLFGLTIMLGLIAYYHWRQFGDSLTTGYDLAGEKRAFAFEYLQENFRAVGGSFLLNGKGFVVSALLGLFLLLMQRRFATALFLTIWSLLYPLIFCFYFGFGQGPSVYNGRFLLPSFPPLIILTLFLFQQVLNTNPNSFPIRVSIMSLVFCQFVLSIMVFHPAILIHRKISRSNEALINQIKNNPNSYPASSCFVGPTDIISQISIFFGNRYSVIQSPTTLLKSIMVISDSRITAKGAQFKASTSRTDPLRINYRSIINKAAEDPLKRSWFFVTSEAVTTEAINDNNDSSSYKLEWLDPGSDLRQRIYRILTQKS